MLFLIYKDCYILQKKILTERYNAEINYDSFSNANNINGWIEYKTLKYHEYYLYHLPCIG